MEDGRLGQMTIKYLRMTVAGLELQGEGESSGSDDEVGGGGGGGGNGRKLDDSAFTLCSYSDDGWPVVNG